MAKGIHLNLLIGPAVPVPVPREVIEAIVGVKVMSRTRAASGFEISFRLKKKSPLHTLFLLAGGGLPPVVRVVIVVTVNGLPVPLMDGVMTHHQVSPGTKPGESILTVIGEDLTKLMDFIPLDGIPYPGMPPELRVLTIVGRYAPFGVIPMVLPVIIPDISIPIEHIPRHQGTDLAYVKQLANEAGYVFYIDPGPAPGTSVAYWGPEVKVGFPQPALSIDMDAHTNVESLTFSYDSEKKELPIIFIQNQMTKAPIPIPVPDISPLNPPLGALPPIPKTLNFMRDTAKLSPMKAALKGVARASETSDVVTARGELDVLRYGRVLKARKLVGVRGAGPAFNGLYYVAGVTHTFQENRFKQRFELTRNALLANVPVVPV